ncbi:MAG: envelope biogenesis factor ElyC [Candidatus Phlomobacter fragariae]
MLFTLKKYIGSLLMPLPLLILVSFIGLLLLWFTHWQKSGKCLVSFSWLTILLLSLQPIADKLLLSTEGVFNKRYELLHPKKENIQYIVVLGGGFIYNPNWPPSANLINNSLARVTEGIRLYSQYPGAKLIFTGGRGNNTISNAEVAAKVALSLGVPETALITLTKPRDTEEEAFEVEKIVDRQPFLLVTSANHMARAERFFIARNMRPITAPANQLAITSALHPWEKFFPSIYFFSHSERAWYEFIGSIWQSIKTDNTQPLMLSSNVVE